MKISELLSILIKDSDLTIKEIINQAVNVSERTLKRYKNGEGLDKLDAVFEVLTEDISTENTLTCFKLIKQVKAEIGKD